MSEAGYPLSPPQRRLWARAGLRARTVLRLEIEGVADGEHLERALLRAAAEHEVLSCSIRSVAELGLVVETPGGAPPSITRVVVEGRESAGAEDAIAEVWSDALAASGEQMQLTACDRGDGRWTVVVGLPTLHGDAGTAAALAAAVAASLGEPAAAQEDVDPPFQYAQYAAWLEEMLESEEGQQAVDYWTSVLARQPAAPRLPLLDRGPLGEGAPAVVPVPLEAAELEAIEALAPDEEALSAPWVALWAALVARLDPARGQRLWALGLLVDGRRFAELEQMPGLLARDLPLIVPGATAETLTAAVARWTETLAEAEEWSDGFDASAHGQEEETPPWTAVGFERIDLGEVFAGGGARVWASAAAADVAAFTLQLRRWSGVAGGGLEILADPRHWCRDAVADLASAFATLSRHALAHPDEPFDRLPLVGATSRARLLGEWARGPQGAPFVSVHRRIAAVARRSWWADCQRRS